MQQIMISLALGSGRVEGALPLDRCKPLADWEAVRRWWLARQDELPAWQRQAAEVLAKPGQIEEAVAAAAFTELVKRRKFLLKTLPAPVVGASVHQLDSKRKALVLEADVQPECWQSAKSGKLVRAVGAGGVPLCKWRQQ